MRFEMLRLLTALSHAACAMDAMAADLASAAHSTEPQSMAVALRMLAQRHRIEALRLRGAFAVARDAYDAQYGVERDAF